MNYLNILILKQLISYLKIKIGNINTRFITAIQANSIVIVRKNGDFLELEQVLVMDYNQLFDYFEILDVYI